EKKSGDFNLCLFGKDNFGSAISALNNKSIGNQPIKIRSISDIEAVKTCHIVFISEIDRNKEQKIKQEISSLPVLLVTDNAQREHYHIAIIQDDERLSFTINIKALKEAHLNLSSRLLNLAKEVTE
ncbi:MAG: YfiR family protein, partial [Sulfurospirillaceae bacterium]|nr:YfiR family protein [Sulfurospirillaceae bacterium]